MNILVVGSGGREHALCWALARSPKVTRVNCAPGNAGIEQVASPVAIGADDVDAIVAHATEQAYDLVVVGPEAPLVAGLCDRLRAAGIATFGPSAEAARLEGSKVFAKEFMDRHGIPTAGFRVFGDPDEAIEHVRADGFRFPTVIKADGLAAGKGVLIVADGSEAESGIRRLMVDREFGAAGDRIVIEDCLVGREASFFVLADGREVVDLATCQDYKRASDGDAGPNTGGMGTYSPSAYLDDALRETILNDIVAPTVDGLARDGSPYQGILFIGLMLTDDGPKVLEYNCRFGDPETQVLLPRLDGDWADLLDRCARGNLAGADVRWSTRAAVCVVLASGGYPGPYVKGRPIDGLEAVEGLDDVVVFHAGTRRDDRGRIVTAGGRVLGVTALGDDLRAARTRAYAAADAIRWDGVHRRNDIALDAV